MIEIEYHIIHIWCDARLTVFYEKWQMTYFQCKLDRMVLSLYLNSTDFEQGTKSNVRYRDTPTTRNALNFSAILESIYNQRISHTSWEATIKVYSWSFAHNCNFMCFVVVKCCLVSSTYFFFNSLVPMDQSYHSQTSAYLMGYTELPRSTFLLMLQIIH